VMPMPAELRALMERYCQLGSLLPDRDDDVDLENPRTRAGVDIVLEEMARVKREIDEFLAAARRIS
jgi:hypothetical protein